MERPLRPLAEWTWDELNIAHEEAYKYLAEATDRKLEAIVAQDQACNRMLQIDAERRLRRVLLRSMSNKQDDDQHDGDVFREEMSIGGRSYRNH